MKYLLLFSLMLIGCTSSMTILPTKAGVHTLYFEYWENGKYNPVKGHASTILDGGSIRRLRVLVPRKAKGVLLVTDDGDELFNYPIEGEEWIDVDLSSMPYNTKTNTIGLSMATKNYDVMTGRLYLIGNLNVTEPLEVDYRCPYKKDNLAVGSCTRPNGFNFFLTVKVKEDYAGKMRVSTKGVCEKEKELYDLDGASEIFIKITNSNIGYCNIRIDTRQDRQGGEWVIKKFKEINVNYFDGKYVFLGIPEVTGQSGDWEIKATDKYKSYILNGRHRRIGRFIRNHTIKSKDDRITLIVWDKFGRTAHVRK